MGFISFMRMVGATGSFSEAYLMQASGVGPHNYTMRTEAARVDDQTKGPKRVVIHQGTGPSAQRAYDRRAWGDDIRRTAHNYDMKRPETDWRLPYGQYPPPPPSHQPRGWFW
jgi:hypothetical protein